MNMKLALKSAAVSLALAFASITAFAADSVTGYVPSDASAVLYVNFKTLVNSPAFGSVMESFGVNLDEMLGEAGLSGAKDADQQAVLFVESDTRAGLVINAEGSAGELKNLLLSDEGAGMATKVEFEGAEAYELKDEEHGFHGFVFFLPDDRIQILLGEDMDMKPELFAEVEDAPALVRSLKADESFFAVAFDTASFLKKLSEAVEKFADDSEAVGGLAGSLGDPDEMAKDFKTVIFRIASGADNSIDLFLTVRFTNANVRGEFVKQVESLKTMMTPAEGAEPNDAARFLESLKVETKGNDAVISLNISEDAIQGAVQSGMAAAMEAMGGESGAGALGEGEEEIDYEALVPLEETPDPDEEGIDEEERAKRIQMREEAVKRREEKIAELRAQHEQGAVEAKRIAALNKEMFAFLKEKEWDRAFAKIEEGADVNAKDEKGRTPAFYCVENGNLTILSNLDSAGKSKVDPNAVDNDGMSLLHCAVLKKQDGIITYLLKVRACSPRTQFTKTGASPLYDAARIGTPEMVKNLVTYGADPNVARKDGLTPLHQAAARGSLEMAKDLVAAGAEVNAVAENGRTPLFYAAARGKASTANFLLENKAEINLVDKDGYTPLHCAAASGNVALVKFMVVNKKANFAATAKDGTTVLIAGAKSPEIVKFLADRMPNVNAVDKDGNSVLHLCVETADVETIRKLLLKRADEILNLPNKKGETPLHLAVRAGNVEVVKRLVNMENVKVTQKIVDEAQTDELKSILSAKLKK